MITYDDFARTVLCGSSLSDKLFQEDVDWSPFRDFELPRYPGRNAALAFSEDQVKFPKAHQLTDDQKKAIALHSFANHELLAIEMMAAALLIYPHRTDEDIRFKKGVLSALKDEQKHLSLYIGRLNELGFSFGDFPLNDFFWRQMEKLRTPEQYLSVMALTFEAANLDFASYYQGIFSELGDQRTASILATVLEDEISHVAFGSHWMKKWREDKSLWEYYRISLPWPLTPARGRGIRFNQELHQRAMGDADFVALLSAYDDEFPITRRM